MNTSPQVSVVIPTRNRPDLLIRAVNSVLAQTADALEVVVVIDGPDEDTVEALAGLGDARVRPVPLPESGGAPNARNTGVKAARAPWVALLDDDDEWLPTKLAVQLESAASSGFARPIVATRLLNRTPRAEFVMPRRLPAEGEHLSEYFTVRKGLFHGEGFIQTSTIMAPTELLLEVPFKVGLRRTQELDWTLRAIHAEGTGLVMVDAPLVLFNQDEDRERITLSSPWESQLEWLRESRSLFTPRAYAAYTLSVLSSMAASTRSPRIFRDLLKEARTHGRPGPVDYVTHLQIWALPPHVRHVLRDKVLGRG